MEIVVPGRGGGGREQDDDCGDDDFADLLRSVLCHLLPSQDADADAATVAAAAAEAFHKEVTTKPHPHTVTGNLVVSCDNLHCQDPRCGTAVCPATSDAAAAVTVAVEVVAVAVAAEMDRAAVAAKEMHLRKILAAFPALATDVRTGARGKTALHHAAGSGCTAATQALLAAHADPNARDNVRATALHWAASKGHAGVVRCLLESGQANVRAFDEHDVTPLHCAASVGHAEIAELCLRFGAHADTVSQPGWMPLHSAARGGHLDVVTLLLNNGAPTHIPVCNTSEEHYPEEGKTPFDIAIIRRHGNQSSRSNHDGVVKALVAFRPMTLYWHHLRHRQCHAWGDEAVRALFGVFARMDRLQQAADDCPGSSGSPVCNSPVVAAAAAHSPLLAPWLPPELVRHILGFLRREDLGVWVGHLPSKASTP